MGAWACKQFALKVTHQIRRSQYFEAMWVAKE